MRIGMVHHRKSGPGKTIPTGGATVHLDDLCDQLHRAGHGIELVLPGQSCIEDPRYTVHCLTTPHFWPFRRYYQITLAMAFCMRTRVFDGDALGLDCLHLHTPAMVACRTPVVYSVQTVFRSDLEKSRRTLRNRMLRSAYTVGMALFSFLERRVLHRADRLICISRSVADEIVQTYGVPREKIRLIPNPVNTTLFRPGIDAGDRPGLRDARGMVILFVGRADNPRKGLGVLLRAFRELRSRGDQPGGSSGRGPEMTLVCVGSGTETLSEPGVIGVGPVPREELPAYYANADVFVIPSLYEPQGIVVLEAMACGTAVVGSDVGGIPEMITHEKTGLLFPPGDAAGLSASLGSLLTDPGYRRNLGKNARTFVERKYSWDALLPRFLEVYDEVASRAQDQ